MLQLDTDKINMVVCILGEFVYYLAQVLMKHHCKNYWTITYIQVYSEQSLSSLTFY